MWDMLLNRRAIVSDLPLTVGWHHCTTCYQILIAATRFLSGIRRWNRCQVSGFDKADDLYHLATLAPVTKSHAFLGILSCAFWILGLFWGPVAGARPSATFRGSPLRRHTCTGKRWKCQGWDMCTTNMEYGSKLDTSSSNIELGALSICSLDIVSRLNS